MTYDAASQFPGFVGKLQGMAKKMPAITEKSLNAGASLVVREAQMHHLNGPTSRGSFASAVGISAMPMGESLSRRTHRLFRSIAKRVSVSASQVSAEVGSNVVYARIHEYGGLTGRRHLVNMPARPYLRPSVITMKPAVYNLIRERIMDSYVGSA